ncbi:MAG: glycosyltransferase [Flavobacteriia bacterium]|nr:glycosyltransferase [Flavobacteriia bacterium]
MKVLFVSRGNIHTNKISNIVSAQGKSLSSEGISITYYSIIGKGGIGYLKNIQKIRKLLDEEEFDIIHAHYGLCGIISYFAKRKEKLVVSLMGGDILGLINQNGSKNIFSLLISYLNKLFAKFFFDYNIVKSQNIQTALLKNTKSIIIPNGVNFETFYPTDKINTRNDLQLSLDKKIILFATNPNRIEKNYQLAKEGVSLLDDSSIQLEIIYDIDQEILNKYYNAADLILLTSFHEGSPNVIKEALACNKVIVSTDVGDVRQNFQNVQNCFITSFESKDLAINIKEALKHEVSNGRESINHLNSKTIANKIIQIYNFLLDS